MTDQLLNFLLNYGVIALVPVLLVWYLLGLTNPPVGRLVGLDGRRVDPAGCLRERGVDI